LFHALGTNRKLRSSRQTQGFAIDKRRVKREALNTDRQHLQRRRIARTLISIIHTMPPKKRDKSPSATPVPSTESAQNDGSHLTQAQWEGMQDVLNHIYDYRTEE